MCTKISVSITFYHSSLLPMIASAKMSVFNAAAYSKYNYPQRYGAFKYLVEHYDLISSLPYPTKVLDVGCGTGENTKLLTWFNNIESIVAFDRDIEMVAIADCFNDDPRISYSVGDVENGATWPKPNENSYHLALSFFVLHWIHDQENALKRIYDSLLPGGYFLARLVGKISQHDIDFVKFVKQSKKWSTFQRNSLFPKQKWLDEDDPAGYYTKILSDAGFSIVTCKNVVDMMSLKKEEAFEYLKLTRLHKYKIPVDQLDHFAEDSFNAYFGSNVGTSCSLRWNVIDIVAKKCSE